MAESPLIATPGVAGEQTAATPRSASANKTVAQALTRINDAHGFYRNELIRVETLFATLLLPAGLTFVSALTIRHAGPALQWAHNALVGFFLVYLVLIVVDLCGLQYRESEVRTLQNRLYALPAETDSDMLDTLGDVAESYRLLDAKMAGTILINPIAKIIIASLFGGIGALIAAC